jgi:adenylate kinase
MLIDEVNKHPDTNGILFDGYQELSQAIALDAFMISMNSGHCYNSIERADENFDSTLVRRRTVVVDDQDEDKSEIATRNTMKKTAPLMQYYNDQGSFMP